MDNESRDSTQSDFNTAILDQTRQEVRQLAAEVAQAKESMTEAMSDVGRAQFDMEQYQIQLRSLKRRGRALWAVVVLLCAGLVGVYWRSYPMLKDYGAHIGGLSGMNELLSAFNSRLNSAEEKLTAWIGDREQMTSRMDKLEKSLGSNLNAARKQARQMAAEFGQSIRTQFQQSLEAVQARLARVEAAQETDRARLAQLRAELASVRQEIAGAQKEAAEQMVQLRQGTLREFSDLDRQLLVQKGNLEAINNRIDRRRLDFEVPVHQDQEFPCGINLTISHTNVSKQLLYGWLRVLADGRTLWVLGHGIQQPVVFYTKNDARPYEIVFTHIKDNGVAGYMLVPNDAIIKTVGESTLDASAHAAP